MKTRHILLFIGAVFFFLFLTQIGTRAFWSQEKGRLIWHEGQVLSDEDDNTVTYIIRPKPTATPAVMIPTPVLTEVPTPTDYAVYDSLNSLPTPSPTTEPQGGSSGIGCLPAGTKVRLPDMSEKNIEDIRPGEYVLSFDGEKTIPARVLEISRPVRDHLYTLHFADGTILQLTREHPVFTKEGWKSISPETTFFLKTSPLTKQDSVLDLKGYYKRINAITYKQGEVQLYNLKYIETTNSFFANDILVHNKMLAAADSLPNYAAGSFLAGTKILMQGGVLKNIESVKPGDNVITYESGRFGVARVTETNTAIRFNICTLTLSEGTLLLTPETPVYTRSEWKAIDSLTSSNLLQITVGTLTDDGDSIYYSAHGTSGRFITLNKFECVPSDYIITYNITKLDVGSTYFANNYLVHNKSASQATSSSSSQSSSRSPISSSSSSSSALVSCGTKICTSDQTCFMDNCWLKCGVNGYCAGLYTCVSNACIPTVGGSSSSVAYAPTITPIPTSPPSNNLDSLNSTSSYSSRTYVSPVIPERPTNTPYPTRAPKNATYFESAESAVPVITAPSPTPIPSLLRGKTSTIVIEDEKSTTILKGEDVALIKIAAAGGNQLKQSASSKGPFSSRRNSGQLSSQNAGNSSVPLLELGISLKQQGLTNFGIQQEEIVLQKGKQVVTISAQRNDTGMLAITQNNTTALTSMNMSINPTTNILTIETPYGPKRVSIMPDEALGIIRQLKIADQGRPADEVRILVRNNQLEYKILASKLQKLLWLIPIVIPQEVYVSADTGGLMAVQKSPLYRFVSLFAF